MGHTAHHFVLIAKKRVVGPPVRPLKTISKREFTPKCCSQRRHMVQSVVGISPSRLLT
jgi:hypothetical protein